MSYNKEWEQIKTEYKEIPVPEHGMAQMEEAMERAVYHRSRRRKLTAYGAIAAALLLILVLPRSFMGGFGANSSEKAESTAGEIGVTKDNLAEFREEERNTSVFYDGIAEEMEDTELDMAADLGTIESFEVISSMPQLKQENTMVSELVIEVEKGDSILSICLSKEEVKAINQEISCQMERALEQSTFLGISEEQAYYINEDGLLVVVWEETIEFIIPKTIIFIEE